MLCPNCNRTFTGDECPVCGWQHPASPALPNKYIPATHGGGECPPDWFVITAWERWRRKEGLIEDMLVDEAERAGITPDHPEYVRLNEALMNIANMKANLAQKQRVRDEARKRR